MFHGPRGGRLKQDMARTIFRRDVIVPLAKLFGAVPGEVGFADGRFYGFRHYFVSQCFAHGASAGEVKEWVGHKDSAMVAHYRHQFDDLGRQRIQRVQFVAESGCGEPDGLAPDPDGPELEESA